MGGGGPAYAANQDFASNPGPGNNNTNSNDLNQDNYAAPTAHRSGEPDVLLA